MAWVDIPMEMSSKSSSKGQVEIKKENKEAKIKSVFQKIISCYQCLFPIMVNATSFYIMQLNIIWISV